MAKSGHPSILSNNRKLALKSAPPLGGGSKRLLDIIFAGSVLLVTLPLFVTVGVVLLLVNGRPIFFSHQRIGFKGKTFRCLKFRTMARNSENVLRAFLCENPKAAQEWEASQKLRNDPRISPFGAALRRTSIDELPQLLNVLRGDMSCVGPRPITREEMSRYGALIDTYLKTRPGLTGLWQVQGRSDTTYDQRVKLDTDYVTNWSYSRDLVIILKTLPALLSRNGSY
jgi:exopolysaccharide production protein ExoY